MDSYYAPYSTNQYNGNEDGDLYSSQSFNNNIDELLKSPLLKSYEPCAINRHGSSSFLFDYKDLYDMNPETNDNLYNIADHIPETNYKVWLNSMIIDL